MKRRVVAIFASALVLITPMLAVAEEERERRSEPSFGVMFLDGVRYYIHTLRRGDSLYSLSRMYGVEVDDIRSANSDINGGMTIGVNLKIPLVVPEEEEEKSDDEMAEVEGEVVEAAKASESGKGKVSDRLKERERGKDKRERKVFDQHIVNSGETLYSISRQHNVTVSQILGDNPTLDPSTLAIGQSVNIRKIDQEQQVSAPAMESVADLESYQQLLSRAVPAGYAYYLVAEGDTLDTLCERFDMGRDEIAELNNIEGDTDLPEGVIILIKYSKFSASADREEEEVEEEIHLEKGRIKALGSDETLEIALLLPLSIRGYAMKPFVEFYQGFLMGVEELKSSGRSVVINLFNTERSSDSVAKIISDPAFKSSHLIVGPVYEEFLPAVLTYAERHDVPVVSPLVTLSTSDSPMLFQVAPNPSNRYDKLDDLFGFEQRVTLIYGESNDAQYERDVLDIMARYYREIERFDYRYEHPSVISERERLAEERMKIAEMEADSLGVMLDEVALDSLVCHPSPSDLTPLVCNEAVSNLFFVLSDNETEVDRILSAFASAYTAQVATNRGSGRRMSEVLKFNVIANPAWRSYDNIDRAIYFRDRVYNFPSYVAGRDSQAIRDFDSRYAENYSDFASQYAYRGYDVAKIFGEGMYGDIEYNMMEHTHTPLQTMYRFERAEEGERFVNTNWVRVLYNLDFTTKIE